MKEFGKSVLDETGEKLSTHKISNMKVNVANYMITQQRPQSRGGSCGDDDDDDVD